ncbi:MAG: hypothetical protein KQJ78_19780 [Deltaproteobacteria bacterium]|nr:hypothetical protein [Deltaproteobacteria bacterium]
MRPHTSLLLKALASMGGLALCLAPGLTGSAQAQVTTELVSQSTGGAPGDTNSYFPIFSAYGDYAVFHSGATNLVIGDTNGLGDVFVRDRISGVTTRVSVDSAGAEGNAGSYAGGLSGNGRYVAFYSDATNLVAGDTNLSPDVFVHDRLTGETTRVSVDSTGLEADSGSYAPSISADGRYVAFHSAATNLVTGDTNGWFDIFVHDRQTGQTTRVSLDSTGLQGDGDSSNPVISADGRFVAFESSATNLVPGDTNALNDVFVHDRTTGQTTRVSLDSAGLESNGASYSPAISGDGAFVTFDSGADNLVTGDTNGFFDVFVHERATGLTTRVSLDSTGAVQGDGNSNAPDISANGRWVAFQSDATNLVTGDTNGNTDIFLHDRQTGATTRQSVSTAGVEGDSASNYAAISLDGTALGFYSLASNFAVMPPTFYQTYARSPLTANATLLMYRAYNPTVLGHFFTTRHSEFANAVANGYTDESTTHPAQLFLVLQDPLPGLTRVLHRLYNPNSGRHHYTYNDGERNNLVAAGWNFERDEGYIFTSQEAAPQGSVEVFNLYNTVVGSHLYTISASEAAYVVANIPNWQQHTSMGWATRNTAPVVREAAAVDPNSSVVRAAWALSQSY